MMNLFGLDAEECMAQHKEEVPMNYRKKPVVISAIKWDGTNLRSVVEFMEGNPVNTDCTAAQDAWERYVDKVYDEGLIIKTLEGQHIATRGDYIIKGVKGEHYPCKPDIFLHTYEPAD